MTNDDETLKKPGQKADAGDLKVSIDSLGDGFLIAEYNAMRREIELQISERRKAENTIFFSIAAVYAWVLTRDKNFDPLLFRASLVLPVVLACLGFLRWAGIQMRTMTIGEYLSDLEKRLSSNSIGWETYLSSHRKKYPIRGRFEGWSEVVVWCLIICATVATAIFLPRI
ncbi:MAG: hypothetical protein KDJ86_14800 [Bauldia sp.]|uniref:hypothetical protein n=1 Tax=Bauldia sp. TaxID=2575872 RepID=UPI001D33CD40|nr:hypothetical protein [Bauldia sp.]MCB1497054.1 hypothetical protein [Bauldia sp.]